MRLPSSARLAVLAVLVIATAPACGGGSPHAVVQSAKAPAKAAEAPAPEREAPAIAAPAPDPVPEAVPTAGEPELRARARVAAAPDAVVAIEAGAEPRRTLALQGRVGERRILRLTLAMAVAMDLGTRKVPSTAVPQLEVSLLAETTAADAEGVTIALTVTDVVGSDPPGTTARVKDAVARTLERLRSTKGSLRLAPDGRLLAFDLAAAPVADAPAGQAALEPELGGLAAALQELLPAVPATAVGDGARWTSVRHVRRDAVRLEQTGAWTLALAGDAATLTLASEHVATNDAVDGPGMIEATSGTTRAEIVLGPGTLPQRATATVDTSTRANLELIGAAQRVGLRTVLTLTLEDTGAAPP